jgi:hypothetical protein
MNLMRSICCLFSNRCASEAGEGGEADKDSHKVAADANIAPEKPTPGATRKSKDPSGGRDRGLTSFSSLS